VDLMSTTPRPPAPVPARPARRRGDLVVAAVVAALVVVGVVAPTAAQAQGAGSDPATASQAQAAARADAAAGAPATATDEGGPALASPQAAQYWVGSEPLDDILHWADQRKDCGLTRDQLAAIMLTTSYHETFGSVYPLSSGSPDAQTPSPMIFGRYDNFNDTLYAFGDRSTPYRNAFWNPGVGMWQFDSAGYFDLTAAQAIHTGTAARQAATTITSRWCANASAPNEVERVKAVWRNFWYACSGWSDAANPCLATYAAIYDGTSLRNVARNPNVTRLGGMEERTCRYRGVDVTCHLVDPARAQGHTYWRLPDFGTTPITAPFYSISLDGREHRVWLSVDSGYPVGISADKPIRADARNTLVWSAGASLCDLTEQRGDCGDPIGALDEVTGGEASVRARGWAIDPDTTGPLQVHVYVDGRFSGSWTADASRPDVGAAHPGYGDRHGYDVVINGVPAGARQVCTYAINVGPGTTHPHLGCATASVEPGPAGFWDVPPGHAFGAEVSWVATERIAEGYADGSFRPVDLVSRQAMAAFLQRWLVADGGVPTGTGTFSDVPGDHPFAPEIGWAAGSGVAQGYADGTFHPGAPVSRQAMAAFLHRLFALSGGTPTGAGSFSDVPADHPFAAEIGWLAASGVATGYPDGTFRPTEPVSRQATAAFLARLAGLGG
jgi:hypothetical protein